ncbi:MAG: glycosyltransferase family 4 protein [Candidatus Omnitrophica bacterium]|nr:glycosyltransferase family 4 protein [Candidatus Omnitrophota bacterium]
MRILQLTSHLHTGGITRYVVSLAERLVKQGHRVMVASDAGPVLSQLEAIGVAHWQLPLQTSAEFSPQVFRAVRQLADRLRQEPVEVIHAHTRVSQVVAAQMTRRLGIPYVTTWHGIYQRRLGRRLWPCTGAVTIAISELVRKHLLEVFHVPESRIRHIHNGIDTAYYAMPPQPQVVQTCRQRWNLSADRPVVAAIGRLAAGRVKGFDTLLAAIALLAEGAGPQALIVGDGPRRPFLEDIAERLRIQHRVRFVGEVSDIRIPLALADVFVFTSRWPEAFGLTLVEAMAAGKPIVATRAGAVPEVIRHDVEGWLVASDDPGSMAEGIARLLNDRGTAERLGRHARIRVREAFDLDRMVSDIEAVYREVVHPDAT